jgi:hypothetical protein
MDWSAAMTSPPGQDVAFIRQDGTRPIRSFSLISPLNENRSSARLAQAIRGRDDASLAMSALGLTRCCMTILPEPRSAVRKSYMGATRRAARTEGAVKLSEAKRLL